MKRYFSLSLTSYRYIYISNFLLNYHKFSYIRIEHHYNTWKNQKIKLEVKQGETVTVAELLEGAPLLKPYFDEFEQKKLRTSVVASPAVHGRNAAASTSQDG
jgi:hypothetical protein